MWKKHNLLCKGSLGWKAPRTPLTLRTPFKGNLVKNGEQVKTFWFEIQSQIWGSFLKTQRPFTTTKALWLSTGTKLEFKRGARHADWRSRHNFVCMLFFWCLRFVLLSYVSQWRWREQRSWRHSELGVADRSEGDIMKKSWSCSWLAWLRYFSCLSCCVHVLSFVAWNIELDVVSVFTIYVVMAHDENLGRNSDGIWV